jgi:hypothetical protein
MSEAETLTLVGAESGVAVGAVGTVPETDGAVVCTCRACGVPLVVVKPAFGDDPGAPVTGSWEQTMVGVVMEVPVVPVTELTVDAAEVLET